MDNKRIVWMMDETIANAHPNNWQKVRRLENDLVGMIGNQASQHEVIDPIPCLHEVIKQLHGHRFSCVFDMTGWLTPALQELFPFTPIESNFSLSRVRVVSSPKLETTGYTVSMSSREIEETRRRLDLTNTLIFDDASFSGWTSRKAMEVWGIDPEKATHAFLIANTGQLGQEMGAVPMLESLGSKVVFGHKLHTPEDDGWHLKDLHQNPNLEQSFELALSIQEMIRREGIESSLVQELFTNEAVMRTLFPDNLTSEQIKRRIQEGKFILRNGNVIDGEEIHAKNPFLWASPYFQEHIDINKILLNKDSIVSVLIELRTLTIDPEGRREASLELQHEVRKARNMCGIEGQFTRGKERI